MAVGWWLGLAANSSLDQVFDFCERLSGELVMVSCIGVNA